MRGADLLVRCLEAEGVEHVFGVPGEEILALLDALIDSKIQFVTTRHEQGAALMADVYGRLTGRAGVCLATLGPGATNLITGVADAYLDHAPLVAITGQASLRRMHKESHQYVDTQAVMSAITKWQARVLLPDTVPEVVRKAFKLAQAEKPGATHIELPEDVAGAETQGAPLHPVAEVYPRPSLERVREAAEVLCAAAHPMVLAGNGVTRRHAADALRSFAAHAGVPVANTFMGKGVMGATNPLARLTVGLQNRDYEACGLEDADVVLAVGYDLVELSPRLWNPDGRKRVIHIDTLPAEVDEHYQPEIEIVSEIADALAALQDACERRADAPDESNLKRLAIRELELHANDGAMPMKPQRIIADMRRVLRPEDTVISDVGAHKLWLARLFLAERPNQVIISNGFATMGIAVPGAIAAKLAEPERRAVAVAGDGGFLMNVQELETARRMRTPFVTLVWVDEQYGVIRWKQDRTFGRAFGVDFTNPDIPALARAFGIAGFSVEAPDDFAPTLGRALELDEPAVIAVPVDYSENRRLTESLGEAEGAIYR